MYILMHVALIFVVISVGLCAWMIRNLYKSVRQLEVDLHINTYQRTSKLQGRLLELESQPGSSVTYKFRLPSTWVEPGTRVQYLIGDLAHNLQ